MQVQAFINRLAKSKYVFTGVYCASRPTVGGSHLHSFEVQFEFTYDDKSLMVDGGCRMPSGAPPLSFTLEIPFGSMSAYSATVQLRSPELGTLEGQLLSAGEGFEVLLVSSAGAGHCSLHLQFFSESAFSISGMLMLPEQSLSFVARETGEWEKVASGKVVPLVPRK